ncbi:MAG: hypothetical protein AB7H88_12545 [Vicinamibacterales bacterium]
MESQPAPSPSPSSTPAAPDPRSVPGVLLSPGEFLWLTFAVWLGGVFILTVMPTLLIPRFGNAMGVAGSYFVFFLAWQPVQSITQRALGVKVAVVRMLIFVTGAAALAFYLKGVLLGMAQ